MAAGAARVQVGGRSAEAADPAGTTTCTLRDGGDGQRITRQKWRGLIAGMVERRAQTSFGEWLSPRVLAQPKSFEKMRKK